MSKATDLSHLNDLTDLEGITDGTNGQVLTTDGSGTFTFEDASGGVTSVDGNTGAVTTLQLGTTSTTALAGDTSLFSGAYNDLTGKPTLLTLGTTSTTALAGDTSIPANLTDLSISDGTNGQVLTTNGSGTFTFEDAASPYGDTEVSAHLNTSTATTDDILSWNGSDFEWVDSAALMTTYKYTATASQTTFSGADDASNTLAYTAGNIIVTVNGVTFEDGTDYTATNGTSVVFTPARSLNDEVNIIAFTVRDLTNIDYSEVSNTPTIPTELTDLSISDGTNNQVLTTNGSGTFTFEDAVSDFASLTGKPTTISGYGITDALAIGTTATTALAGNTSLFSGAYADLTGKPTLLTLGTTSTTALAGDTSLFSGAYNDLTGTPTIPTNNNQLTNGAGYVTSDTNTTYTADGDYGMTLSGTAFRLENDRRRNSTTDDVYSGNTHDYTFYDADVGIRWYTAGAEEMRLEDDGDLHVDGNITAYSTTVSDERLKSDIKVIDSALDKVNSIGGYTFTYHKDEKKSAGVLAQEVEKVLPSAVKETELPFHGKDGETYKTVEYDQLVGLLIESVKELSSKVEELEKKLGE